MDLTNELVLNNFTFFNKCVQLLKIKNKTTKKEICQCMGTTKENINLIKLLQFLEYNDFIRVNKERIPFFYVVNKNELAEFLRDSKFFEDVTSIIKITKPKTYNF